MKTLAGAGIALVVGTVIGYIAGQGFEASPSRAEIEATDNGMRLRLDPELRTR
jgi:hypothetical protein